MTPLQRVDPNAVIRWIRPLLELYMCFLYFEHLCAVAQQIYFFLFFALELCMVVVALFIK
jgi:hypothetical protein